MQKILTKGKPPTMPEAYRYAFAVTLSLPESLSDDLCHEFVRLCKKGTYYAVVFELDANGRKHAHAGVLYQLARKAGNVKLGTFCKSKLLQEQMEDPSRAIKVKEMHSDSWIANYMQKDGHIDEHNALLTTDVTDQLFWNGLNGSGSTMNRFLDTVNSARMKLLKTIICAPNAQTSNDTQNGLVRTYMRSC